MARILLATVVAMGLAGCAGRPSLLPNSDVHLRKDSTQFAADAAKRFPYKLSAPRGEGLTARAEAGYMRNVLEVVNLSDRDWEDVEVWVNQQYVVFVPEWKKGTLKHLDFQMIYDDAGNYFPTDNSKVLVRKVELYIDGKMYDVPVKLSD